MTTPQKAYFQKLREDGETSVGGRINVLYNPTELSLTKAPQLAEIGVPGLTTPLQQFVRGQAARLSVELFFDRTDDGMDSLAKGIVEDTDKIYDLARMDATTHVPPVCRFVWGSKFPGSDPSGNESQRSPHFVGVMENIEQRFDLFSPKGIPLRAKVTVRLREYKTLEAQRQQLRLASPDRSHRHVVRQGETLASLAAHYFSDPGAWRPLATANAITNPRRLVPGRVLRIPPLDDRSRAAVANPRELA